MVTELHSLRVSTRFCIGLNVSLSFIFSQDNGHHAHLTLPSALNCMLAPPLLWHSPAPSSPTWDKKKLFLEII